MSELFKVHLLNEQGIEKAKALQNAFTGLLNTLEDIWFADKSPEESQNEREKAIVRTKLEEASFFAKKAMAMCSENQK